MITGGWRGPGWQVFHADPRIGRQVRDWITAAISGHDCPVDAADTALVVTELFSNAVRHGPAGGRILVGYCLWQQGARLVVCDGGGPDTPRLVHGGELAEGGRACTSWTRSRPGGAASARPAPERCGATSGNRCTRRPATPGPGCTWSCPYATSPPPAARSPT